MPGHTMNGQPPIDNTGARYKPAGNGPGYMPPAAGGRRPRFGQFGTLDICSPWDDQECEPGTCESDLSDESNLDWD